MRRLLWGACLAALVYETIALGNDKRGDTISELLWKANRRPIVPFAAGVVAGHIFWQEQR